MKKSLFFQASIVAIIFMQGCAPIAPIRSEHLVRTYSATYFTSEIRDYPVLGEIVTAEVGESLIRKDKYTAIPSIDIEQPIEFPSENMNNKFTITVLPGRYIEKGHDETGKFYEGREGNILSNGQPIPIQLSSCGIYISNIDSNQTEVYFLSSINMKPLTYERSSIPFSKSTHYQRDELSFKKELVYTGVSKNVVSILYREFLEDMARPAFSQELKYDLTEGKIVGYRGARFEIIKATNQGITYKTLTQLD